MKMILFNQNPMIEKLLESVSKKLELSIENFNHYQELSSRLKGDPEWLLIADDECLEKLDQVDWLELKETISQNKNSVCMYKKGNEAQPFLEGFEMKIKKPFLPTEMLKVLQKKLGSNMSELEPSQNSDPTQEILETNWDELENLGDLEALAKEEPNNEEQLLPTLNEQEGETPKEEAQEEVKKEEVKEMQEEIKEKEKQEVAESPQDEEKPKDDETQGSVETPKDKEVSKELETQEQVETPKEETQEQEPIKEETQENKEEKQEKTQDSPSAQELEAMQELVKEIQENSNDQENKKETQENQENTETPQDIETQELEIPKEEETQEVAEKTQAQGLEKEEIAETPQELEVQDEKLQENETLKDEKLQENETLKDENMQENAQNLQEKETQELETPQAQDETLQEDHYESIEDIPEPVMAKAMGEELPFLNEAVAKTPNNENDTETPKESVIKTPQEKEESDKTSSPLELRLNLQDLLKSLNQESFKSLLENKTLSIKITLEDKKPNE
ncbi:chemotaxis regulatory protein ChePep [Helicobacter pylori]|uniref:chemotaxis regulatory protein ChePep n=1 Tax=Helicobacter pylori TaxID=210 RepID=UPI00026A04F5|nr:chemotaxis regulatory protein ChePep [Helicobacter pylori]EJB66535.1 poly E-rich protein [Helicobacter pylori Hp H-44]